MIRLIFGVVVSILLSLACSKTNNNTNPIIVPVDTFIPVASIYLDANEQTVNGFGGATAFQPNLADADVATLFGNQNDSQLGLSILRIRIAPSDSTKWKTELSNALRAKTFGAIVMASPWTPPAYMKTNNNLIGGRLNPKYYSSYATYLNGFTDYMKRNGAELYAVSIQNEPDWNATYESCFWSANEMTNFINGNTFNLGNTKLLAAESYYFKQSYTDSILNDSLAASKLGIIGGHIYGGGLAYYFNAQYKGKDVWMTEHLDTATNWNAVMGTAKEIYNCLALAKYNAYIWWYLKRYYGPIDESGNITKRGYVMAQFSKYIRPGYKRVNVSSPYSKVLISAYKGNANKVVLVAINTSDSAKTTRFVFNKNSIGSFPSRFSTRITSATQNLEVSNSVIVVDSGFNYVLPPSSIVTFSSN